MNARLMLLTAAALAFAVDAAAQDDEQPISIPSPSVQISGEPAPAVAVPSTPAVEAPLVIPAAPALPAGPSIPSPVVQVPANPQAAPAAAVGVIPAPPAPTAAPAAIATVPSATPAAAAALAPGEIGTTIIGDQESPIGLYITPWKDDYAERGLDRPARLLDEAMEPIDPATFRRQIEYYETITEFRRQQRGEVK